jgi:hypothetical protein
MSEFLVPTRQFIRTIVRGRFPERRTWCVVDDGAGASELVQHGGQSQRCQRLEA